MTGPDVTIAIPTTLSESGITSTVGSALEALTQCGPQSEVLVVANGPQQKPGALKLRDPRLRVVHQDRGSAPAARNLAFSLARTKTLLFTDDDCDLDPSWATGMAHALTTGDVVCGPVDVAISGPVTAYLDYQRFLDAPATSRGQVKYLITANCGVRTDRIPTEVRFDADHFNNAAEDADIGYRLRDAGVTLAWMPDLTVTHRLQESITQITERFTRYGRGNATLVMLHQRWEESAPNGHRWYRSIRAGEYCELRRFTELDDPHLAACFTLYDLARTVSFLLGYLEVVSAAYRHPIVTADTTALQNGWDQLHQSLALNVSFPVHLGHDLRRWPAPVADSYPYPLVADLLQRTTALHNFLPTGLEEFLGAYEETFTTATGATNLTLFRAWDAANPVPVTIKDLEPLARACSASLPDAAHDLEKRMTTRTNDGRLAQ
jgi:glycosyltransferase involved in cell wall biosynthesis